MKHDEKKIEEIRNKFLIDGYRFNDAIREYAEHMVQQERERIVNSCNELKQSEVCDNPDECHWCGRGMYCRGHQEEITSNETIDDIINLINKEL